MMIIIHNYTMIDTNYRNGKHAEYLLAHVGADAAENGPSAEGLQTGSLAKAPAVIASGWHEVPGRRVDLPDRGAHALH